MLTFITMLLILLCIYCIIKKTTPKLVLMRITLYIKLILIRLHIL